MPEKKKMGRPTDNPKRHEIKVRFDDVTLNALDSFCARKNVTRVEGIRIAVRKLNKEKE